MKQKVKIAEVKPNPNNPRTIKDAKFKKLVESIKTFPDMLEKRPIVVDENMVVLGGNMRLKACKKAGLKEVWIDIAEGWSEEQKAEFIIKDNLGFGEWNWDDLNKDWDLEKLEDWGLEVPSIEEFTDEDETEIEFSEYLDEAHNYVVLLFDSEVDWLSAQTHFELKTVQSKRANGKPWSKGIGRVINGANYLKGIKNV